MKLTKLSINSFSTCWLQRACYYIKYTLPPHFFLLHVLNGVIAIIFKWGLEKNLDNFLLCLVFSSFRLLRKNSNQFHVISKVHHIRNASLRVIYFRIVCSNKRKVKKPCHCYLATSLTTKNNIVAADRKLVLHAFSACLQFVNVVHQKCPNDCYCCLLQLEPIFCIEFSIWGLLGNGRAA